VVEHPLRPKRCRQRPFVIEVVVHESGPRNQMWRIAGTTAVDTAETPDRMAKIMVRNRRDLRLPLTSNILFPFFGAGREFSRIGTQLLRPIGNRSRNLMNAI